MVFLLFKLLLTFKRLGPFKKSCRTVNSHPIYQAGLPGRTMLFREDAEVKVELGNLPRNKRKPHLKVFWKVVTSYALPRGAVG